MQIRKDELENQLRKDELENQKLKDENQMRKDELENQSRKELSERELQTRFQLEAAQKEHDFELHKSNIEHQHALELAKASTVATSPVHHTTATGEVTVALNKYRIDVLTKMVPRFDPNDVDLFFTSFERTLILIIATTGYAKQL